MRVGAFRGVEFQGFFDRSGKFKQKNTGTLEPGIFARFYDIFCWENKRSLIRSSFFAFNKIDE